VSLHQILQRTLLWGLATIASAHAAGSQPSSPATGIHLAFPPHEGYQAEASLLEVRGHVGERTLLGTDLVIALDLSDSTLLPVGIDLDGDGPAGRTDAALLARLEKTEAPLLLRSRLRKGLDFEDTVLASELEAANALIDRLDMGRFRVGITVFSSEALAVAPVGSSRKQLKAVLDQVPLALAPFLGGTNLFGAVETARIQLAPDAEKEASAALKRRRRVIVLLTDGEPTLPTMGPALYTEVAARRAADSHIRVIAFPIGPKAEGAIDLLTRATSLTSGAVHPVEHPGDVVTELRRLDLAQLAAVEIVNNTPGQPGRSVRFSPDGSFDGFLSLEAGPNVIVVRAKRRDGREHILRRQVVLGEVRNEELVRSRLQLLRDRTREIEMWAEIEASRRRQRKVLDIEADSSAR